MPGGGEPTTAAPSGLFGGLPGAGLPEGGGPLSPQGDGQDSTLVLGGFSALLVPVRGASVSSVMSTLSGGQQLGQMLPKPTGRGGGSS